MTRLSLLGFGPPPNHVTPEQLHPLLDELRFHKKERAKASADLGRATTVRAVSDAKRADEHLLGQTVREGTKDPGTPNQDKLAKDAADAKTRLDRHTAAGEAAMKEVLAVLDQVAPDAEELCRQRVATHLDRYEDALAELASARSALIQDAGAVAYWQKVSTKGQYHYGANTGDVSQVTINGRDIPLERFGVITDKLTADVTRIVQTLELGDNARPSTTVKGF